MKYFIIIFLLIRSNISMAQSYRFADSGITVEKNCSTQSMLSLIKSKGFDVSKTVGAKTIPFDSYKFENSFREAMHKVDGTEEFKKFATDFRGNLSSVESLTTDLEILKAKQAEYKMVQDQYKKATPSPENEYRVDPNLAELARRKDGLKAETERLENLLTSKVHARLAVDLGCLRGRERPGDDVREMQRERWEAQKAGPTASELAFKKIVQELRIELPTENTSRNNSWGNDWYDERMRPFPTGNLGRYCESHVKSFQLVSSIASRISQETKESELKGFDGVEDAKDFLDILSFSRPFAKMEFDSVQYYKDTNGRSFWVLQNYGKAVSAHIMNPKVENQTVLDSISIDRENYKLMVKSISQIKFASSSSYTSSGLVNDDVCKVMQKFKSIPEAWGWGFDSRQKRDQYDCELQGGKYDQESGCMCPNKNRIDSSYSSCFKVRANSPFEKMSNEIELMSSRKADLPNIGNKELSLHACSNYFPSAKGTKSLKTGVEKRR